MSAAHTLPNGHEWLSDAFERAWRTIEDSEKHFLALSQRVPDEEFSKEFGSTWVGAPNEVWNAYDESRRRVERLMRTALASGHLRAMIRDTRTGEPAELANRERWIEAISFGVPGLSTELHHLTCPGPRTDGAPVFVRGDELERFIHLQLPALNSVTGANLISRTPWALAPEVELSSLDQMPNGDWVLLSQALSVLSFGSLAPPADLPPLVAAARRARTGAALLDQARHGKVKLFGTCATVGRPETIPVAVFAHDLAVTHNGAGFDINPERADMESFARFRDDTPHALRWNDVAVLRSSLRSWVSSLLDEISPAPLPKKRAAASTDIEALKAAHSGVWPDWRTSDAWRKASRPEVSRDSFQALWRQHAPTLKRGRKSPS
ncbi:hypothetical protein [Bosea sp. (in: a-proteobacteria)]|jgi:hypothetical protein|uniref:hypothetical protein n=1 Tax=Bosea sp. (in: a-proteobacteria) TaxID=1871050 RepID=UPI002DDCD31E|nr:hypothetical protein [Bosea sp. (in: a-proteobacteria)]HEV2508614.1 hypothetical protein [Bosea sp. (in: a-proteobacteria)]